MSIPILDDNQVLNKLKSQNNPFYKECFAYYSSWYGGITKSPELVLLPLDDHMAHRGDGVFEAMKAIRRKVYLLDEHLKRLFISAESIFLTPPCNIERIKEIVLETLHVADQDNAFIRVFISRGPGNFSVNPYDTVSPQLYVAVTALNSPSREVFEKGVVIGKSHLLAKPSWMATVKSCNYLVNVLMKKEAVDRKLDFVISVNSEEHIAEGATENIIMVDKKGIIVHPPLDCILKGTMMVRACELASQNGLEVQSRAITLKELKSAREIIITGTSLNILPVVKFEDFEINNGKPGPIAMKLNKLILEDIG